MAAFHLGSFARCLAVPGCALRLEDVMFFQLTVGPYRRQSQAMDRLPVPETCPPQSP